MTEVELFQKLRPVIQLVTGLPNGKVVMADQSITAPAGEYVGLASAKIHGTKGFACLTSR